MDRRRFLTTVGTGVVIGLGGCASTPDEDGADGEGNGTTTTGTTTSTATATTEVTTTEAGDGTTAGTTEGTEATTDGTTATTEGGGGGGGATTTVEMVTEDSDYYFDPVGLYVEPGTTVTWVNESGSHSSTAYAESVDAASVTRIPDDAEPWDSGIVTESGAEFTHTFETTGTYDYFCTPHKTLGMIGRLVVGEPGGPATEGSPPDGDLPSSERIVEQGAVGWQEFSG